MSQLQMHRVLPFTKAVKVLLFFTVAMWFLGQIVLEAFGKIPISDYLALHPLDVLEKGFVWQAFSYQFLHSLNVTHILFNMLMLWFFGSELEQRWGARTFTVYYLLSGVGAALIYVLCLSLWALATGSPQGLATSVVGASGAIYGLMLAHGILFGERTVYFFMLFPMKNKYFVLLMGLIQFASMVTSQVGEGSGIAYLAHLGGLVAGYILLKTQRYWGQMPLFLKKKSTPSRRLKLVVNNEAPPKNPQGPKYWN